MRDRRITVFDEAAMKAEVSDCAERFRREDMPKMRAGAARLAPHIDAIYRRAMATPLAEFPVGAPRFGAIDRAASQPSAGATS